MPAIDLSILNQRQTPAFYADTLANRPSAGFIGRIFVSTNTFEFYRDNGTTWDLIGGPGTSTVTGTGANGQVTYWNGTSSITGSNDLFFDAVNGHLGIGTITPGTALDIKHDQNTVLQLEQVTATNDIRIAFINSGVGLWRLGAFYNAGANDFALFDVVNSLERFSVKNTGQTFVGAQTSSSGKLVVNQTASDNGIVLIGTTAPSIRIRNAGTAPTQQVGMAISTGVNNFIQGSASGDFCLFNGSTTASPILFGVYDAVAVSVQEAARVSAARNLLVGTSTDSGQKLIVNGNSLFTGFSLFNRGTLAFTLNPSYANANVYTQLQSTGDLALASGGDNNRLYITSAGNVAIANISADSINSASGLGQLVVGNGGASPQGITIYTNSTTYGGLNFADAVSGGGAYAGYIKFDHSVDAMGFFIGNTQRLSIASTGAATFTSTGFNVATFNSTFGQMSISLANNGVNFGAIGSGLSVTATASADDTGIGTAGLNKNIVFATGTSYLERARITSSGNLLIGTTTDNGNKLQVNGTTTVNGLMKLFDFIGATSNNYELYCYNDNTFRINFNGSGSDELILSNSSNLEVYGSMKTGSPAGGTSQRFKSGSYVGGAPSATGYIEFEVNGILYKLLAST